MGYPLYRIRKAGICENSQTSGRITRQIHQLVTYNFRSLKLTSPSFPKTVAAKALSLMLVRLTRQTAVRLGESAHRKMSKSSLSWKLLAPTSEPFSLAIFNPNSHALSKADGLR